MELNDYGIGNERRETQPAERKFSQHAMRRKPQEFIDHTLLAPEYIRDSNSFIIDLIEQPPSEMQHTTNAATNAAGYMVKDALGAVDLQFHNPIFQLVNKQCQIDDAVDKQRNAAQSATLRDMASPTQSLALQTVSPNGSGFSHKHTANDFMALSGDFLSPEKTFCNTAAAIHSDGAAVVPPFPALSLLAEPAVTLDDAELMHESDDIICARSSARKVLPHKKRISRKLKVAQSSLESEQATPLMQHKLEVEPLPIASTQFSCEICGHSTSSQLEFFAHLKQHYEPTTPDTILAAMKTSLEALEPEKDAITHKTVNGAANVDPVFHDVHLNFDSFHAHSVHDMISRQDEQDDMKILNTNSIEKCINFVSQGDVTPLKIIASDEVEFSDTEDMLEGIRNVVDKVSIEDTCDDIDLMAPNGMRTSWFANEHFSSIVFKSKPFSDVSFSESLAQLPETDNNIQTVQATTDSTSAVDEPKESLTLKINKCDKPAASFPNESHDCEHMEIIPNERLAYLNSDNTKEDSIDDACKEQTEIETENIADADDDDDDDIQNYAKRKRKSSTTTATLSDNCDNEDELNDECEEHSNDTSGVSETLNAKRRYPCTKCGREFNSSNALKYHLHTHLGVRPHQCDVCGKSFFAQGALKSHIRTHTNDKPFECEHCERKFRQWGDLKYHTISVHTKQRNHQCEFCGKAFSRKYSLDLHRRIHTSERNYKCEWCDKSFRASTYLQNHRKIHTGEKPYECNVCKKRFRVCGDLGRHMRIHARKPLIKAERGSDNEKL